MGQHDGADSNRRETGGSPQPEPLVSPPLEHTPDTAVRSGRKEDVARREEQTFGSGFSFAQIDDTHKADAGAVKSTAAAKPGVTHSKETSTPPHKIPEPGSPSALPVEKSPSPQGHDGEQLHGVNGMIASARDYWNNLSKEGADKGGVSGHTEALAADAMGLGVDAFEASHNLFNKVFPDGVIAPSREYWKDMVQNGQKEKGVGGAAKRIAGNIMDGALGFSGLGNVEDGANKVVKDVDDVVPVDQLKKDAAWLGVDTVFAAATFIPGATGAKAMGEGGTLFRTARAGAEITGMTGAAAEVSESVGGKLLGAIRDTLPEAGEKLSKEGVSNFVGKLGKIAREYGIEIREGGVVGECNGGIDTIEYSSKAGGPHEVAHVLQQLQTRATALESEAANLGKTVAELNPAERAHAFDSMVRPFEDVAYNQHEMWAGQAHSWGVSSSHYSDVLAANVKSFEKALSTGTVPEAAVSVLSRAYGELPNWLGRSQAEIAKNLGAPVSNTMQHILDKYWKNDDII